MGDNGSAKLQSTLLAENSYGYSVDASSDAGSDVFEDGAEETADIEISGGTCYFDTDIDSIKGKGKKLMTTAFKWGYQLFPINRNHFRNRIASNFLTEENICNALTSSPNVSEANHNAVRDKYKGKSVSEEKAWGMGVVADRVPVKKVCDDTYDYGNSPVYNGIESCQDVLDEINGHGLAVVMYVVDMEAAAARTFFDKPSSAPLYTDYGGGKPKACGSGKQDGRKYKDSFHSIPVIGSISVDFVMRTFFGKRWGAWNLRESCDGYQANDLKFNFGARVFIPITVDEGDGPIDKTIIITSVAAASNMTGDFLVPKNTPYHRTIGAETAKKILGDAKAWGWDIN